MKKPQKPYPDFPLFAHASGRWAKKVKKSGDKWGFAYFGPWDDPYGALAKYRDQYGGKVNKDQNNVPPTKREVKRRPKKPRPDFPLYAHAEGKWCIKIRGISHYFGRWGNPDKALQEYMDVKDDLLAGRPITRIGGVTIRELCNRFLASKQKLIDSGELAQSSWDDYHNACEKIIKAFGKGAKVANLRPVDFEGLRASLWVGKKKKKLSPVSVSNNIGRIRVIFNYAEDEELIPGRVRYGKSFQKPSERQKRKMPRKSLQRKKSKKY